MKLFTIGFTQKSAEEFFTCLQKAGVRRVVDIRLHNTSQLAGFAKAQDLKYFLCAIGGIEYVHIPDFAPTQDILDDFQKSKGTWAEYERRFGELMAKRGIADTAANTLRENDCFLCSEPTPERCHRRLVAEHLQAQLGDIEVIHL
ncbi:MAG: hypothetical protein AMJ79_05190 [Phycisphaerae bacterium SM23_30]|nr:MAG: hypothetical protein AMJ79_05190 [Phycisphaerae bacterium SM23_30]